MGYSRRLYGNQDHLPSSQYGEHRYWYEKHGNHWSQRENVDWPPASLPFLLRREDSHRSSLSLPLGESLLSEHPSLPANNYKSLELQKSSHPHLPTLTSTGNQFDIWIFRLMVSLDCLVNPTLEQRSYPFSIQQTSPVNDDKIIVFFLRNNEIQDRI